MKTRNKLLLFLALAPVIAFQACDKEALNTNGVENQADTPVVSIIAGTTDPGYKDGPAAEAQFTTIIDVGQAGDGSLYILEKTRIRKLKDGVVSTVAGTGTPGYKDGPAASAQFANLTSIGVCADNTVYVSDFGNNSVRRITPGGIVSTYAGGAKNQRGYKDGPLQSAQFNGILYLGVADDGTIFITEQYRNPFEEIASNIRKITPQGTVKTISRIYYFAQPSYGRYLKQDVGNNGDLYFFGEGNRTSGYSIYKVLEGTDTLVTNDPNFPDSPIFFSEGSGYATDLAIAEDGSIYLLKEGSGNIIKPVIGTVGEEVLIGTFPEDDDPDRRLMGLVVDGKDFYSGYGTQIVKLALP